MIILNENENEICRIILEYATSLNPPTIPRFAGGWVRDKILKKESNDIDVALDNISGYNFAEGLSKYIQEHALSNEDDVHYAHKIMANPDKSKHLETAVLNIRGVSIDFANLRNEEYAMSRIPKISQGTPVEDALRRDLTINALFYNLLTKEIEDFTGNGLADIQNKIIRTPLDPQITLLEDPLRILRIFRFKAKMQFLVCDDIYQAIQNPDIRNAMILKVSNERIDAEITKMLDYNHGYIGIIEMIKTNYISPIFKPRVEIEINNFKSENFYFIYKRVLENIDLEIPEDIFRTNTIMHNKLVCESNSIKTILEGKIDIRIIWLYAVLHNYLGLIYKNGGKPEYVNALIMKESFKASRQKYIQIKRIEENLIYLFNESNRSLEEIVIYCKELLFESLMIAAIVKEEFYYFELVKNIINQNIYDCYKVAPIVNGNDFKNTPVRGVEIKKALEHCFLYQIRNPKSTKEDIINSYLLK